MSTKNKAALEAARAKYKELYNEEPAANLGLDRLTKAIQDFKPEAEQGKNEENPEPTTGDPVKTDQAPEVPGAPDPENNSEKPGDQAQEDKPEPLTDEEYLQTLVKAAKEGATLSEEQQKLILENEEAKRAVFNKRNEEPITKEDLQVNVVYITNGVVTKPYSKFAWDKFLSKAPGKWKLVASTPPELKALKKGGK